MNKMCSYT